MSKQKPGSFAPSGLLELQRQMLELQKSAFNSSFQVVDNFQKQQEESLRKLLEQVPGMPEDAGSAIESWTKIFRESRKQYFEAAQKGFDLYGQLIDRAGKSGGEST